MKLLLVILSVAITFASFAAKTARFATVFTDNLVLQQKSDVKIWGYSNPGETISLKCSWISKAAKIVADKTGNWLVTIQTPEAGFVPQSLVLSDSKDNTIKLSNILIGEVWLCSGQSNMEMAMQNQPAWNLFVENSEAEIATANFPTIRFLTVNRKVSFDTVDEITSSGWKVCNPENVKWVSAVAYFFGKQIFQHLDVPVGLVISSYGGSPIQSWIPGTAANSQSLYSKENESRNAEIKASKQTEAEYEKAMFGWINDAEAKNTQPVNTTPINLTLPINFEKSTIGNQQGEILLSKEIDISRDMSGKDLNINLGTMDDLGRVYFNGELVWSEIRNSKSYSQAQFTIPANKVKAGTNLLEVKVLNVLWGGGLTGPKENMYFEVGSSASKISLAGEWQYHKIFDLADAKPLPCEGKPLFSTISSLYNGMIYPLINFKFRGCLWYQGESNVGDEQRYPLMQADMIISWRKAFGEDFPFYYVQIAPYNYGGMQEEKVALLRNAQARVVETVQGTGMVATIDIGNPGNIHPAKKKEVGDRLAWLALSETYHKDIACKYPALKTAVSIGNSVVMSFSNVYKNLISTGNCTEFEISNDDKTYFPAQTLISGDKITVSCPQLKNPRFVRYCWRDTSIGTIFNSEKLPLSTFKAEVSNQSK